MMFSVLLLISIINFEVSLTQPANDTNAAVPRIFGGHEAINNGYPYIARIRNYRDRANAFCTGSIIHENWILTAGHCLREYPQKVVVGTNWASGYGGQAYEINETYVPDDYTVWADVDKKTGQLKHFYSDNDVGLVQLKSPIDFTHDNVVKIALDTSLSNYVGQEAVYIGWGKVKKNLYSPADRLQYAQASLISTTECQKAEPAWVIRKWLHMCLSPESNSNICPGDAGAPLVHHNTNKQIGLANHGTCGVKGASLFQRVSAHYPWIKETLEKHGDELPN